MSAGWGRLQELFCAALERPPDARRPFLDQACGGDGGLRAELEAMLAAETGGAALRLERHLLAVDDGDGGHDLVGRLLGPWRLVEPLGRGGTAEVYVAERADGEFRQRVAVKVVQPGWSPAGLAERLRVEREILASLRHPAIAHLLDGGVTGDGRPYLVMELIDGLPITAHCDRHRLSLEERLRLFVDVCRAVQSAHGALVVHRDLKPSNILVAATGEVKLLDFGIAKLLDADRFEIEVEATRHELRLLTPRRAAPEQFAGGPITTATDVWGLGVLLHELLTGRLPHDGDGEVGTAELERRVCGSPAERPSAAVARLAPEVAEAVAAARGLRPQRLVRRLRGDLDRIVGMALRLEAERRYASAGQLADDVERALANEPVAARPESWTYRASRFVRRHRWAVASAAVAGVLLVAATAVTALQSRVAARERDHAQAERDRAETVAELLVGMLEQADPVEGPGGDTLSVTDLLALGEEQASRLEARPELQASLRATLGRVYAARSRYDDARRLLESALATRVALSGPDDESLVPLLGALGQVAAIEGRPAEARRLLERALQIAEEVHGPDHPVTARALENLAIHGETEPAACERLVRRALAVWDAAEGDWREERAACLANLARVRLDRGDRAGARALYREALALASATLGPDHPYSLGILSDMVGLLDDPAEELEVRRRILAARTRRYGDHSAQTATAWNNLGTTLAVLGRHREAREAFLEALARWEAVHGAGHWEAGNTARNVGRTLALEGRDDEALPYLDRALAAIKDSGGVAQGVAFLRSQRAVALARAGRPDAGRREAEEVVAVLRRLASEGSGRYLGEALVNLGLVLLEADQPGPAAAAFAEARQHLERQFGAEHPKTLEAACGVAVASARPPQETRSACAVLADWGLADPQLRRFAEH